MSEVLKPCLHCIVGRAVKAYIIEHDIQEGQYVLDALADVVGDVIGGSSDDPVEWQEAILLFNIEALKRALTSKEHWDAEKAARN